jgi:hypothetical protein
MIKEPAEERVVGDDVRKCELAVVSRGIGGPAVLKEELIEAKVFFCRCLIDVFSGALGNGRPG